MLIKTLKKQLWRLQRIVRSRLGIGSSLNSPDRIFQENTLIPNALKNDNVHNVLYVGVAWYTYHYYRTFFCNVNHTTLDISSAQAIFGCKNHITGGLDSLNLAPRAPFDVIFLLGVLNYGINDTDTFISSLKHINRLMAQKGCCYLTVEERMDPVDTSIHSTDMIRTAEAMQFTIAPVSDWFAIVGGHAKTRFFVLSKSPESVKTSQAIFSPPPDQPWQLKHVV